LPALALYLVTAAAVLIAWRRVTVLTWFSAVVIVLLPCVITGRALMTNRAFGGYDLLFLSQPFADYAHDFGFERPHDTVLVDHVLQMAPWRHEFRRAVAAHEWPLWNPSMLAGDILASSMQVAPYNPVNWLELLLHEDVATTYDASIYLFFAALFTFSFAVEIGCSAGGSLVAATGYALSSGVVFFIGWPHGRAWCLLPLVLLAVWRVVRDRDVLAFSLLTIAFVMLIVTGHPESMLHVVAVGGLWGGFALLSEGRVLSPAPNGRRAEGVPLNRFYRSSGTIEAEVRRALPAGRSGAGESTRPSAEKRKRATTILIALGAGVLALLITAISLLPFLEALPLTFDYRMRQAAVLHGPEPIAPHLVANAVGSTLIPYYGGAPWRSFTGLWDVGVARVGSVILALAIIAALRLYRRREVLFFAALAAVTIAAGWQWWPVRTVIQRLPLFNMALNERLGIAAAFAISILAAFGWDSAAALCGDGRLARRGAATLSSIALLLTAVTLLTLHTRLDAHVDLTLIVSGAAAELTGLALLFAAPRTRYAVAIVLIAIVAQRFVEDSNNYPTVPHANFYPRVPLIDKVPRDPMYRVTATGNLLVPNVSAMYDLDDVRGYASMTFYPYFLTMPLWCPGAQRVYHDVTDLSRPFLSFLGVRYAFTPRSTEPPAGWRVVADDRETRLVENTRVLPRVFVPRLIRFIDNDDATLEEMSTATDFADTAWLFTASASPQTIANGTASLRATRNGSRFEIDADAHGGTHLVISETAWPGWRAYVDRRRVNVDRANRAFLSVYVPPGRHHVSVVYLPDSFVRGRAITLATLLAIAIYSVFAIYQRLTE
jgi:hypothetical protein